MAWFRFLGNRFSVKPFLGRNEAFLTDIVSPKTRLSLLVAVIIGVAGGYGAVGFYKAISLVQQLSYGMVRPDEVFLLSKPWYWRLLVPIAGGLIVGPIVTRFAQETRGRGVAEVIAAVATKGGIIRMRVAVAKIFASAITIGTGGSAGSEGPVVQIGSSLASALGQLFKVSPRQMKTFVGCGAAAGIAATFNAPAAGMLFAAEVILGEFGMSQLIPIITSAVVSTAISRQYLGYGPTLAMPRFVMEHPVELIHYGMLGVAAALTGVAFAKCLHFSDTFFERIRIPEILKPALGGLCIGIIGAVGLPHVYGVGYQFVSSALHGELPLTILLMLIVAKIIATSITIGSGGSGGIFAPSLLLGAMVGGVVWHGARLLTPDLVAAHYGAYALVGMAAVVASTTRAPLQAIFILFELTGGYEVILPVMISSTAAIVISSRLMEDSIYTVKLRSRGILIRRQTEVNVLKDLKAGDVMRPDVQTVQDNTRLKPLLDTISDCKQHSTLFVVDQENRYKGYISFHEIRSVLFDVEALEPVIVADDIANLDVVTVTIDTTLDVVMRMFARKDLDELPVVEAHDPTKLIGTIHRHDVVDAYNTEITKRDLLGSMVSSLAVTEKISHEIIAPGCSMIEIEVPAHFVGKDLQTLDLRKRHGISVLLVRHHEHGTGHGTMQRMPTPDLVLRAGDVLLISGPQDKVEEYAISL